LKKKMQIQDYKNANGQLLVVKCLEADGTGYKGYDWSTDSHDVGERWDNSPECNSGGFYGWPLGIGIGDGKIPNAVHPWIVVAIDPDVPRVMIEQKIKFKSCKVVYRGTMANCMYYTMNDRVDWIERNASGSASSTGWGGSASSTGWGGSASSTGESGSASSTGARGSASSTGARGSASSTGERGSASSTGERGIASITNASQFSLIEVSKTGIAAVIGEETSWKIHTGALLIQRWEDGYKVLRGDKKYDGKTVLVVKGVIREVSL
jgi:hypothetical protein